MIKPLHRKRTTSTRCALMLAAPSRDWNVFKQICAEHWDGFTHAQPRYQTAYDDGLVAKRLACGNPDKMGSRAYRCLHCGQGKHRVAMSCQSSVCLRCAKVSVDTWVSQVSQVLHEGGDLSPHHPHGPGDVPHDVLSQRRGLIERVDALRRAV